MNSLLAAPLVAGALANLALGGALFGVGALAFRYVPMHRRADARFAVWYIALVAVALAFPAWLLGARAEVAPRVDVTRSVAARPLGARPPAAERVRPARIVSNDLAASEPNPVVSLDDATFAVWFAGALVVWVRTGLGLLRLRAAVGRAPAIGERVLSRGTVRIVVLDLFAVPAAIGYRTPTIMLPRRAFALGDALDIDQIIEHELAHLRRFDDVTALLQLLVASLVWFNPFAHAIAARVAREREMACDEAVVAKAGARRSYIGTLCALGCANDAPAYLPAFGSGANLAERLENLVGRAPAASARAAAALVATALVCGTAALGATIGAPRLIAPQRASSYARIALSDGEALVVGMREGDGAPASAAQLYDARGRRIALVPMRVPRWGVTATVLANGDVLVLGGAARNGVSPAAEIYDVSARRFHAAGRMLVARIGASATLLEDGRVLIAGGMRDANRYVRETEIYDPRTGRSRRTADGDGRVNQRAVLVTGGVLMYGGEMSDGIAHCAILYDVAHRMYRKAGHVVRRDSTAIVSRRADGRLITYSVSSG